VLATHRFQTPFRPWFILILNKPHATLSKGSTAFKSTNSSRIILGCTTFVLRASQNKLHQASILVSRQRIWKSLMNWGHKHHQFHQHNAQILSFKICSPFHKRTICRISSATLIKSPFTSYSVTRSASKMQINFTKTSYWASRIITITFWSPFCFWSTPLRPSCWSRYFSRFSLYRFLMGPTIQSEACRTTS